MIRSQSVSEPERLGCDLHWCLSVLSAFPLGETGRLEGAGVGYFLSLSHLGFGKVVPLRAYLVKKNRMLWEYFKMTSPNTLQEEAGNLSPTVIVKTW